MYSLTGEQGRICASMEVDNDRFPATWRISFGPCCNTYYCHADNPLLNIELGQDANVVMAAVSS